MFADLDETIRQLLIKGIPLDLSEVDVSFEAPDREWSGRLSRPTINCFLYDVRENLDLRATDFEHMRNNGKGTTTTSAFRRASMPRTRSRSGPAPPRTSTSCCGARWSCCSAILS